MTEVDLFSMLFFEKKTLNPEAQEKEAISEAFPANALLKKPFLLAFCISIGVLPTSLPVGPPQQQLPQRALMSPPGSQPSRLACITPIHHSLPSGIAVTRGFDSCQFVILKKGSGDQLTQLN